MNDTVNISEFQKPEVSVKNESMQWNPAFLSLNAENIIILCYCPFLVVFGTIGNILSIMVFSRKGMKSSTMSVYSRFMASSDLVTLYAGPLVTFIKVCLNINITSERYTCKAIRYSIYLFTDASAYTIISLTTERLLSVLFPHKVRLWCSMDRSYCVVVLVFTLAAVTNSPILLWSGILIYIDKQTGANITTCKIQTPCSWEQFWIGFDMTKFTLIPFVFITISNVILLVQLYGRDLFCGIACKNRKKHGVENDVAEISRRATRRKQRSVVITLVSVSVIYVCCNLPTVLFPDLLENFSIIESWDPNMRISSTRHVVSVITNLLMFTNNCVNFILYCVCGTRFRQELIDMACFWRRKPR